MEFFVLTIVIVILYFIGKNYKTEEFKNINLNKKEFFRGDILNHEAGLLIALLAKVAKADGKVGELEAELIKHTLTDISSRFENSDEVRGRLKELYKNEKDNFSNLILICERLYNLTKNSYDTRVVYLEYILNLAFIDGDFSKEEQEITEDIAKALKIDSNDYYLIVQKLENLHKSVKEQEKISLDRAYEILNSNRNDDDNSIKKKYRELVKNNHPDIISGRGESQSKIDEATRKLQELNEAYELIKKNRGI